VDRVTGTASFDPHIPTDRTAQAFDVVQELLAAFLLGDEPDFAAMAMGDMTERLLEDQQLLWETFLYLGWVGSVALIELGKCRDLDTGVVAARLTRALRKQALGEGPTWEGRPEPDAG
jgi:hypothetical protein